MSAVVELRQRIESIGALIEEHERAALRKDAPPSLYANIRALEKQRRRLEREFEDIAAQERLDVYRYRLLLEADRRPLVALAKPWSQFQALFSAIYDSLKNGAATKPRGYGERRHPINTV